LTAVSLEARSLDSRSKGAATFNSKDSEEKIERSTKSWVKSYNLFTFVNTRKTYMLVAFSEVHFIFCFLAPY